MPLLKIGRCHSAVRVRTRHGRHRDVDDGVICGLFGASRTTGSDSLLRFVQLVANETNDEYKYDQ